MSDFKDVPEPLRPIACHGVDLRKGAGSSHDWTGDCPLCGKERHLFANPKTGLWDCKVCGESGNPVTFLTKLAEAAARRTTRAQFAQLSKSRGIPAGVLRAAGVGWHDGVWLIPCRSEAGTIRDLRRYDGKRVMSTAGCKSQLWNADKLARLPEGGTVWLCEGEWDGHAMEWLLRDAEVPEDEAVAVAVPGATVFKGEWAPLFAGKRVVTAYDHDDAGDRGQIKSHAALDGVAASVGHVCWPEAMADGWDLRDYARAAMAEQPDARRAISGLMELARPSPRREVGDGSDSHPGESASGKADESQVPEAGFGEVLAEFERFLTIDDEFRDAIKVCLAVALSNDVKDNPVWIYLMGPAGVGKTELLTSMQGSKRCVFRSKVTPNCLVSGWRGEGSKDPSLIPKLKGKTFVAKDFTEILGMPEPAQREIYSTLRGAFDGYVDKSFGNGMDRHYHDCHFSMIAGVTPAILKYRENAMGERFLKYRLSAQTDDALDAQLDSALGSIGAKRDRDDRLQNVVTGFLKKKLPKREELPAIGERARARLKDAARLVAAMRTQVERDQRHDQPTYMPERESPIRVAKQLALLAVVLAWIDGEREVGEAAIRIVEKVALDTVCGFDLDIVSSIMGAGGSASRRDVADLCSIPTSTVSRRMEDLVMTGIVDLSEDRGAPGKGGGRPPALYVVRPEIAALWRRVKKESNQWQSKGQSGSREPSAASGSTKSSSFNGSSGVPGRRPSSGRTVRMAKSRA